MPPPTMTTRACVFMSALLGQRLHVSEHTKVDARDDDVGECLPVDLRGHLDLVPRAAFEARAIAGKPRQTELAASRAEVAVEVRSMYPAIRAPLGHRRRLTGHVEREAPRLFPAGDRLDERPGRELTVADRADTSALDPSPTRKRHAEPEDPRRRRGELAEAHDVRPH